MSVFAMLISVRTHQLNGQLPVNPSCKDASSRQPASFCLRRANGGKKVINKNSIITHLKQ